MKISLNFSSRMGIIFFVAVIYFGLEVVSYYISEVVEGSVARIKRRVFDITKERICGKSGCGCDICRAVELEMSPSCMLFGGQTLSIANVREAQRILSWKSVKYRSVLLLAMSALSNKSANSMLKLVEEPPDNTQIFIGVSTQWVLPNTILSRCAVKQLEFVKAGSSLYELLGSSVEEQFKIVRKWSRDSQFGIRAADVVQALWEQRRFSDAFKVGSLLPCLGVNSSGQVGFVCEVQGLNHEKD